MKYRGQISSFWPKIRLWCSKIAAVVEVAAICYILHLPREQNSFIVRRIRFGERLKWGINIFFRRSYYSTLLSLPSSMAKYQAIQQ